jgi:hypothetical protein
VAELWWVSVDGAAGVSGWALWWGSTLQDWGHVKGLAYSDWVKVLQDNHGLVLERGYVGKNKNSAIVAAEARGEIRGFAKAYNVEPWDPLLASEWRSLVGVKPGTRASQKAQAFAMCKWLATNPAERPRSKRGTWDAFHLPQLVDVTEDEAEAVLLGMAYLKLSGALG